MASIKSTLTQPDKIAGVNVATWDAVTENDEAEARIFPYKADKTVQVGGTLGGSTVTLKGSNDGVTYFTLTDPEGTELSFAEPGLKQILENPVYLKPEFSGGAGQSAKVIISAVGG